MTEEFFRFLASWRTNIINEWADGGIVGHEDMIRAMEAAKTLKGVAEFSYDDL